MGSKIDGEQLKKEISNQLNTILRDNAKNFQTIYFVKFDRTPPPPKPAEQIVNVTETNASLWIVAILALAVIGILF